MPSTRASMPIDRFPGAQLLQIVARQYPCRYSAMQLFDLSCNCSFFGTGSFAAAGGKLPIAQAPARRPMHDAWSSVTHSAGATFPLLRGRLNQHEPRGRAGLVA